MSADPHVPAPLPMTPLPVTPLPVTPLPPASPPGPVAAQRTAVRVLSGSQVLGGVGVASGIAVGGLLAEDVSGSTALAGLSQTATVLGAALLALPVARLMAARGRRPGLVAGYACGALGAALVVTAGAVSSFPLLLVGAVLFGGGTAAGLQARYAATDLATPERRSRALATVVWATTVGVVLGPNLTGPGADAARVLGLPPLTGPYLFSLVSFVLGGLLVAVLLRPDPLLEARRLRGEVGAVGRATLRDSLTVVRRSPPALLALAGIAMAHTVMVGVMVMTPVHMRDGGAGLEVVGIVISGHVAGMYALSPLVGWLADRYGRVAVLVSGQGVLLAALVLAGTAGEGHSPSLALGLFLLGAGWSFALVAGSTLLSESVSPAARPGVQGAADFTMGVCGAAGGALAGVVVASWGYPALTALAGVLVLPVVVAARPVLRQHATGPAASL